ncbi:MAG: hypothetical protein K5780_01690 [Alphaproteobacteria bacterium]|nr:hypothetical protein [Alphaproteobacteria bacterium]
MILIVPSLYGMENLAQNNNKRPYSLSEVKAKDQETNSKKAKTDSDSNALRYGLVTESLDDCPDFINVVKQILKVDVSTKEDAEFLIMNVFRFSKHRRGDSTNIEGKYRPTNFVICDGRAFLSGRMNVTRLFDNFSLYNNDGNLLKQYEVIQLCDVLKLDTKKLEAIRNVNNIHKKLKDWFYGNKADSKTKSFIRSFWNEARNEQDDQRIWDALDDSHHPEYFENPKTYNIMTFVAEYITALHTLKVDTARLKCDEKGLFKAFWESRNAVREQTDEFLEKFGEYIREFDKEFGTNDGESFFSELEKLKTKKFKTQEYLEATEKLCKQELFWHYAHAEHVMYSWRKQNGLDMKSLKFISFLHACPGCERLFARSTLKQEGILNTIMISVRPCGKTHNRLGNQNGENFENSVNSSFVQARLDMESFWKDRNIFLYQDDQADQSGNESD